MKHVSLSNKQTSTNMRWSWSSHGAFLHRIPLYICWGLLFFNSLNYFLQVPAQSHASESLAQNSSQLCFMTLKVTTVKGYKSNHPWETGESCQQSKGASVTSGKHIGINILLSQMPSTRLIVPYCSNPIFKDKVVQILKHTCSKYRFYLKR